MACQWTSFADLEPGSEHVGNITKLLSTTDFRALEHHAANVRTSPLPDDEIPLTCSINTSKFTSGRYHVVLRLLFSDGSPWIVRLRIPSADESAPDVEDAMLSEIATIRHVKANTSIPVPEVYAYDVSLSSQNKCHARYMLMEALPGRTLTSIFAFSVPQARQSAITAQFATYYFQLSRLRFGSIGRLTNEMSDDGSGLPKLTALSTIAGVKANANNISNARGQLVSRSLEYFYLQRRTQSQAVADAHPGDADRAFCAWFLEQALPTMITGEYLHGPFPLCHLDMHYNNILVDEDFNIAGILDWSDLHTGPIELFAANPEFQTYPGCSDEDNAPIVAFRTAVASEVRKLATECHDPLGLMLGSLIGSPSSQLVYRCICTFHWRAQVDARSAFRLLYGTEAQWEELKRSGIGSGYFNCGDSR